MDREDGLEKLMNKLGDFGRYQCAQFILHILAAIPTGIHMISLVTVAAVPNHRCAVVGVDNANFTEAWNSSLILDAIPLGVHGKLDSCKVIGENGTLESCHSWVYDSQYYTSSRGIEWNFVCDRRWMGAAAQAIFMSGVVIGSLFLGPLCDKFGRKPIFVWTSLLQLIIGTGVAFTAEYYTFVVVRFLYGIVCISPFKAGYVLTMELVGPSKRNLCGALFQIFFAVGVMLVGIWGYFIDNRFYLQIIYGLHATILLPHWFLLDESPRWLWSQNRIEESKTVVKNALKMNKSSDTVSDITSPLLTSEKQEKRPLNEDTTAGLADLFKTPNMLRKTLIICGCWFAVGLAYYGLALNSGNLNGNPYLMMFISGFVELPGYSLAMAFVHRIGHRAIVSGTMILGGLSLLTVVGLPYGSTSSIVAIMVGRLIIAGAYAIIYKFTAELYPTVVRSTGVFLGTVCASLSAAIAPMISLLDSLNPKIPTIVFGLLSLFFGSFSLLLPETLGRKLPQSLEDGENFGIGDTCFTNCKGRRISECSGNSLSFVDIGPLQLPEKK